MTENETRELFEKALTEIREVLERNGVQFEWIYGTSSEDRDRLEIQRVDNWRHSVRVDPEEMETYR